MPPAAGSHADFAAFLSSAYGLTPDPWQSTVLDSWLGVREDGKWSSPRCGLAVPRQNGKNGVLEIAELYKVVELGRRVLHTAHEVKTARKAFLRLLAFFDNQRQYPELYDLRREIRRVNGQEAIILRNGGSVEFIARSRGSGRGFSVDDLVMDEAQELTDEALAALLPTISAAPNPQTILTGTPPSPTARGEVFARTRAAGLEGKDPRLCWLEWSCDGDVDLDDVEVWAAANPAMDLRGGLSQDVIADERAAMDEETFARERLGMWPDARRSGPVDMARWVTLADRLSRPAGPLVFAAAVGPGQERASIVLAGRRPDGLPHLEVIEAQGGAGWVPDRLGELVRKWSPAAVVIDPGGPTGGLLSAIIKAEVDPKLVGGREYAQACGALVNAVNIGGFRHQGDPRLTAAVDNGRKRAYGDGAWVWHWQSTGDITPLVAATLALHGLEVYGGVKKSKVAYGF